LYCEIKRQKIEPQWIAVVLMIRERRYGHCE